MIIKREEANAFSFKTEQMKTKKRENDDDRQRKNENLNSKENLYSCLVWLREFLSIRCTGVSRYVVGQWLWLIW